MTGAIHSILCRDGSQLSFRVWSADKPIATIILLNGAISHSGWFAGIGELLSAASISLVGADRRGSGMNDVCRGDLPSRNQLIADIDCIIEAQSGRSPVYLAGWSWGALPAINAALEFGERLSGLILLAPGLFIPTQLKQLTQLEFTRNPDVAEDDPVINTVLTPQMFSKQPEVWRLIRDDPLRLKRLTPRFFRVTQEMSLIAITRLAQLKQRLLVLLAERDETADNARTIKALSRLPAAKVTIRELASDHGMQFDSPNEMVTQIASWINQHATPQ